MPPPHGPAGRPPGGPAHDSRKCEEERDRAHGHSQEQRAAQQPGNKPGAGADHERAEQRAEQPSQQRRNKRREQQDEWQYAPAVRPRRFTGLGRRQRLSVDQPDQRIDARVDPERVLLLVEPRHDLLADDPLRECVGNRAFEPVPDLDAEFAIVFRDNEHDAVVDPPASDLPCLGYAQGILFDRFGRSRRHEQHRDLRTLASLERSELLLERRPLGLGERGR